MSLTDETNESYVTNSPKTEEYYADLARALNNVWMIRPCEVYHEEYAECKSWRGRFHQKFVTGESKNCSKWLEDYNNCLKYRHTQSAESAKKIIDNENERVKERIERVKANDVWEYRTKPPEDWNKPLPEDMQNKQLPKMKGFDEHETYSRCVIM